MVNLLDEACVTLIIVASIVATYIVADVDGGTHGIRSLLMSILGLFIGMTIGALCEPWSNVELACTVVACLAMSCPVVQSGKSKVLA